MRKRIFTIFLSLAVIISMTPALGTFDANAAESKRVEIEILDTNSEVVFGYYVKYSINGIEYRSDTAGERINQIAWKHMSYDQRMTTLQAFGSSLTERQNQFGYDFSGEMANWYNDVTGWTALAQAREEKIIKKEIPDYYEKFDESKYYLENLVPECDENVGAFNEVYELHCKKEAYYSMANEAYEAMCNAEILKYRVAVISLSGDIIEIITDHCLVPAITPSGIDETVVKISNEITGACADYLSEVTGVVDEIQECVVESRLEADDALAISAYCDKLISVNKDCIDSWLLEAEKLTTEIDSTYKQLEAEEDAAYAEAEAADAQIIETLRINSGSIDADSGITDTIYRLQSKIDALKNQEPSDKTSEEYTTWETEYDEAVHAKNTYIQTTAESVKSELLSWRNEYIGDIDSSGASYTAESKVGTLVSTKPESPHLTNEYSGKILNARRGTLCITENEYNEAETEAQKHIDDYKTYIDATETYYESTRALVQSGVTDFKSIYPKYKAIAPYYDFSSSADKYTKDTLSKLYGLIGVNYKGLDDVELYSSTQSGILADKIWLEKWQENIKNNSDTRKQYIEDLKKELKKYKEDVSEYNEAVDDIEKAYDVTDAFAESLPEYITEQGYRSSANELVISSNSELSKISTQAQVDSYASKLDNYLEEFETKTDSIYFAEGTAEFMYAKENKYVMRDMYQRFLLLGLCDEDEIDKWSDIKDDTEHELDDSTETSKIMLKYLWNDFNGRGYSHTEMVKYFADLSDNADTYKTTVDKTKINEFNILKSAITNYNMAAHSYTYNIEHQSTATLLSLYSSENSNEIDPREDLVIPLLNEISVARESLANNIRSVSVDLHIPNAGTRIDDDCCLNKDNLAVSDTIGFNITGVRAVDSKSNHVTGRLEAGNAVSYRIYFTAADGYCIDDSCKFKINGTEAYWGTDLYGDYISTNEEYTVEKNSSINITSQPQDVTYDPGDDITLSCSAEGNNLSYQWKKVYYSYDFEYDKTFEDVYDIEGATESVLTLEDVEQADDGTSVYCEISNGDGYIATDRAKLSCTVGIVSKPNEKVYFDIGSDVSLTIKTKGQNPSYKWYVRHDGDEEFSEVADHNSNTLTFHDADDSYDHTICYCEITIGDYELWSGNITLQSNITLVNELPDEISCCPGHELDLEVNVLNTCDLYCYWYASLDKSYDGDCIASGNHLQEYIDSVYDGGYLYCLIEKDDGTMFRSGFIKLKLGHTEKTVTKKATLSSGGYLRTICSECGDMISSKTIYMPETFKLSSSSYTYSGSAKKPTVTVKDSKGNKLVNGTDYIISYLNNTYPGKASVKITGKGNYSFTKTLTFTINPKGTSISSVSAVSKGFTVKWKKQAVGTTGYQIRYSTSSRMTSSKTVTVSGTSTISKKITGLKSKKKYYVQVRSYKTVSGKKYYSLWSSTKSIKTKK